MVPGSEETLQQVFDQELRDILCETFGTESGDHSERDKKSVLVLNISFGSCVNQVNFSRFSGFCPSWTVCSLQFLTDFADFPGEFDTLFPQ